MLPQAQTKYNRLLSACQHFFLDYYLLRVNFMSSIKETVQQLAQKHGYSIASLERKLGFSNGSISKWDKQSPSADRLQQVADYFDVSVDYLLGRDTNDDMTDKKSVDLNDDDTIMTFEGKPIQEEDRELIKRLLRGK